MNAGPLGAWFYRQIGYPALLSALSLWRTRDPRTVALLPLFRRLSRSNREVWERYRDRQLSLLLRHALREIPYYRRLPRSLDRLARDNPMAALREFPILTRPVIQAHEKALLAAWTPGGRRQPNFTGGSTGRPTRVWHDERRNAIKLLNSYRDKMYTGWRPGDRVALIEAPRALFWHGNALMRALNAVTHTYIGLNAHQMRPDTFMAFLGALESYRPVALRAIASAVDEFAQFLEAHGLCERARRAGLRGVISTCEMLYAPQRQRIERAFGCRVFDLYGSTEVGVIATECGAHEGLHVAADGVVVEVVGDDGGPVPDGTSGRIVVTDLWNLGFSLIRCDLDDVGAFLPDGAPCPCGVTFPRLQSVDGRTSDLITLPDGTRAQAGFITHHLLLGKLGIEQIQVVQVAPDEIEVSVVGDEAVARKCIAELRRHLPVGLRVALRMCDAIPRTAAGKRQFVISRVQRDAGGHPPDGPSAGACSTALRAAPQRGPSPGLRATPTLRHERP